MVLSACKTTFDEFVNCIINSKCVQDGGTFVNCKDNETVMALCDAERFNYFSCRRAQMDMRTRIQGHKARSANPEANYGQPKDAKSDSSN